MFGNRFGDEGALALASSPHLKNLDDLDVDGAGFGPEGMEALARSMVVAGMTRSASGTTLSGRASSHRRVAALAAFEDAHPVGLPDRRRGLRGGTDAVAEPRQRNLAAPGQEWPDRRRDQAILDSPHLKNLTDELGLDDDGVSDEMMHDSASSSSACSSSSDPACRTRTGESVSLNRSQFNPHQLMVSLSAIDPFG